jgi:dTDP-4-dehydrorhamnose 3,5-epimerase
VAWDDPDLAVDWGLGAAEAVLSDKDRAAPPWAAWVSPFTFEA